MAHVCSAEHAFLLDNFIRKWLHNPHKILSPFVRPGMTVVDLGCGPGLFTREMANLVGPNGKVIAVDIQKAMLDKIKVPMVKLHLAGRDAIGLRSPVDFALMFYMLHEVSDQRKFLKDLRSILKGYALLVEPKFHVSRSDFEKSILYAKKAGFSCEIGPRILLSRTCLLR